MSFRDAYDAWMHEPFPIGEAEDDAGVLHDDVALVDTWVAESVVPYVEDGRFVPAVPDVLGELRQLRERAAALDTANGAPEYLRYIDVLSNVYEAFLQDHRT